MKAEQADIALEELENIAKDEGKDGARRELQLEEKIRDLESELSRGGGRGGGRGALDSRGRDLQKRCAMLEADVKDLEGELNAEKRVTTELEEKLEESEKKAKSFKRENEALQADMKELLAQMESSTSQVRARGSRRFDSRKVTADDGELVGRMVGRHRLIVPALFCLTRKHWTTTPRKNSRRNSPPKCRRKISNCWKRWRKTRT